MILAMPALSPFKPSKADLLAARDKTVADILSTGLSVVFVGINPGLYTAAIGHHFGRPGNRFWPALHAGGFTPRLLTPFEESDLLALKLGITNVVPRATATAEELSLDEFSAGGRILDKKIRKFRPRTMAVLGIGAYRAAFGKPKAALGLQEDSIGDTAIWVLPNPSGLNAHFSAADFGSLFAELRRWIQGH